MKIIPRLLPAMLATALLGTAASSDAAMVTIDNFDGAEQYFIHAPTASGSNRRVAATSTADVTTTEFFQGTGSQRIVIDFNTDPAAAAPAATPPTGPAVWFYRHVSGVPTAGAPASNLSIPNTGNTWVGYWLKTTSANLEVGIMLDDDLSISPAGNTHEISNFIPAIADGQWHLYEFELADANTWQDGGFATSVNAIGGVAAAGAIHSATVTIDSLVFRGVDGVANQVEFFVDSVSYNPNGRLVVPEPGSLALLGLGALSLIRRRR